jgi:AcrR family transcriptional regulator
MPKLKPATQAARRENILDAAQACFARAGFHRTTIEDICRQAAISPGALYVYFDSKEALIEGLCERDRDLFVQRFKVLEGTDDLLAALAAIAQQYFIEEERTIGLVRLEMALEATRNPRIAAIHLSMDRFVAENFERLFSQLRATHRIAPALPVPELTRVFCCIGDGLFFRRTVVPDFRVQDALPTILELVGNLLNPVASPGAGALAPDLRNAEKALS